MSFGLTWEKLLLLLVIAAFVIGPERLPRYAELLAHAVRRVRDWLNEAKSRVQDDMGDEFTDVDWKKLDPRQYDPRRIIREALLEDAPVAPKPATARMAIPPIGRPTFTAEAPPPFDDEAT